MVLLNEIGSNYYSLDIYAKCIKACELDIPWITMTINI